MRSLFPIVSLLSLTAWLVLAAGSLSLAHAGAPGPLPSFEPDANAARSAIPTVYRWDLTVLYSSDDAWETEMREARKALDTLQRCRIASSAPGQLRSCLEDFFRLDEQVNRLTLYAKLQRDVENTNPVFLGRHQRALQLTRDLMQVGSWLRQAVLGMDDRALADAYAGEPGLERFRPYLDQMRRRRAHVLSPEGERVLSLAGDVLWAQIDLNELPSGAEHCFNGLMSDLALPVIQDENHHPVQLTLSNYGRYRASSDRRVRREAVDGLMGALRRYQDALAASLAGQLRFDVFLARARHYDTARQAYLDKDQVDPKVYDNLIATVHEHLAPLHRYVELRKRIMKLDQVHLYDLYVPMVAEVDRKVPFPEAVQTVQAALAPLGPKYLSALRTGMDPHNGWLDLYPSRHKESGAYSTAAYGVHPFIMMNYQNTLDDVSTLAHEYGHAMHSHFSMENQPYLTWRYPPFVAEVASTVNEMFLSRYLLAHASDSTERAYLLNELLEKIRTTVYRQTLFAEFELEAHRLVETGQPVTASALNELYGSLIRRYYGPGFTPGPDDEMEWAYIPHFYWKYYVYTYATGLSSAIAISQGITEGGEPERDAYLGMLKGGCSRPPLDLLKGAGVDLTRPDAIQAALALFDRTVSELDQLLVPEE